MSLSQSDKLRIEEEEEYRFNLRKSIGETPKKNNWLLKLFLLFVIFPAFLVGIIPVIDGDSSANVTNTTTEPEDKESLVGNVNFNSGILTISNQEEKDWQSCWSRLNSDYLYPSKAPLTTIEGVTSGESIEIHASEFTLKCGSRFNSLNTNKDAKEKYGRYLAQIFVNEFTINNHVGTTDVFSPANVNELCLAEKM